MQGELRHRETIVACISFEYRNDGQLSRKYFGKSLKKILPALLLLRLCPKLQLAARAVHDHVSKRESSLAATQCFRAADGFLHASRLRPFTLAMRATALNSVEGSSARSKSWKQYLDNKKERNVPQIFTGLHKRISLHCRIES